MLGAAGLGAGGAAAAAAACHTRCKLAALPASPPMLPFGSGLGLQALFGAMFVKHPGCLVWQQFVDLM